MDKLVLLHHQFGLKPQMQAKRFGITIANYMEFAKRRYVNIVGRSKINLPKLYMLQFVGSYPQLGTSTR